MSITRSITRPIVRGIARGIVRGGLDPDAAAYIAAVESALSSSITATKKNAIDTFFKTGKADGWYASIKRLYLPIWEDPAANALCMVSGTSGTFPVPGGVTHSAGYVQSNGSTGYFDFGVSASTLGLTPASGWMGVLMKNAVGNHQYLGVNQSSSQLALLRHTTTPTIVSEYNNSSTGRIASSTATNNGIISFRRFSGVSANIQRLSAGRSVLSSVTQADQGSITTLNHYALARNANNTPGQMSTSELGAWWLGTGVSDANDSAYTLALKNLWETASGLSLP